MAWLLKSYRVDQARLYLTGISAGGEGVTEYVGKKVSGGAALVTSYKIAAFMPMSAVLDNNLSTQYAATIVSDKVGTWAFGSPAQDLWGGYTMNLADAINKLKPNFALETTYNGGHCCWGQFYDPNFKQNGMSIYEWLLQYTQPPSGGSQQPSPPPPASGSGTIPGRIEGEDYSAMSGVQTQSTSDAGGGQNVGWINYRDWMEYKVNVTIAGQYTVSLRVSTDHSGASFQMLSNGKYLTTVAPANTSGFDNWETVTTTVNLAAGSQTLQLTSASLTWWNINWMQFALSGTSSAAAMNNLAIGQGQSIAAEGGQGLASTAVTVYPNPVRESFTIQITNDLRGQLRVQVVDVAGVTRQVNEVEKTGQLSQVTINSTRLAAGVYFVRMQLGNWTDVRKIVRL